MPRHNLHKIAPLVRSLCAKHGIEYQEKPLLRAHAHPSLPDDVLQGPEQRH